MRIQKLTSTDGFIALDLDDAPRSSGVVRVARKILRDGATNLARERTYTYAALRREGRWRLRRPQFATRRCHRGRRRAGRRDGRPGRRGNPRPRSRQRVCPTVPSASWAANRVRRRSHERRRRGGRRRDGARRPRRFERGHRRDAPTAAAVARAVEQRGATVRLAPLAALGGDHLDVVFVGSRPGTFDHDVAAGFDTDVIVPIAPLAVTAKALAVATRRGAVVLPGFVTAAGEVLAANSPTGAPIRRRPWPIGWPRSWDVPSRATREHSSAPADVAEEFLATWTDERPFGRPLA